MSPADKYDGLTIDANCCIKYTLDFNVPYKNRSVKIKDYYSLAIQSFIYSCTAKHLQIKYYPLTRGESIKNLREAVEDLLAQYGIHSDYVISKYVDVARLKLDKLFVDKLAECLEKCTDGEANDVTCFFESVEKDVRKLLNLQYSKPNIPEPADCRMIACVFKEDWTAKAILSGDGHFEAYRPEIYNKFNICVFPTNKLIQIMHNWGWAIKSR